MAGGRLWTPEEKQYLRDNYPGISVKEASKALKRTESAIMNKTKELGICKPMHPWSEKEIEYLKTTYHTTPVKEIAETLNRGADGVRLKANKLGLVSLNYKRPWTDEDTETLLSLHNRGLSHREIGEEMNRAVGTIYVKLRGLGLTQLTGHRYILMKAGLLETGK